MESLLDEANLVVEQRTYNVESANVVQDPRKPHNGIKSKAVTFREVPRPYRVLTACKTRRG